MAFTNFYHDRHEWALGRQRNVKSGDSLVVATAREEDIARAQNRKFPQERVPVLTEGRLCYGCKDWLM
jgi:hypothetical protein